MSALSLTHRIPPAEPQPVRVLSRQAGSGPPGIPGKHRQGPLGEPRGHQSLETHGKGAVSPGGGGTGVMGRDMGGPARVRGAYAGSQRAHGNSWGAHEGSRGSRGGHIGAYQGAHVGGHREAPGGPSGLQWGGHAEGSPEGS